MCYIFCKNGCIFSFLTPRCYLKVHYLPINHVSRLQETVILENTLFGTITYRFLTFFRLNARKWCFLVENRKIFFWTPMFSGNRHNVFFQTILDIIIGTTTIFLSKYYYPQVIKYRFIRAWCKKPIGYSHYLRLKT